MFCNQCTKLAILNTNRICMRCQGAINNNLSCICDKCSLEQSLCSICLKKIDINVIQNKTPRRKGCKACGQK